MAVAGSDGAVIMCNLEGFPLQRPAINAVVRIPGKPAAGSEGESAAPLEPLYVFLDALRMSLHTFHSSFPPKGIIKTAKGQPATFPDPSLALHKVRFCPHRPACDWLLSGGGTGIIRLQLVYRTF
jgi:hypothetical protein